MKPANPSILTINGGSSSIKFALFEVGESLIRIMHGALERIGSPDAVLHVKGRDPADNFLRPVAATDHTAAVALFCYQVKKWIGGFAAALGELDTLVLAGGIGENAPKVRTGVCDGLGFLGIDLKEKENAANAGVISSDASRVTARVIHTDEEWMIAKTVCRFLGPTFEKEHGHE